LSAPGYHLDRDGGPLVLTLSGTWEIVHLRDVPDRLMNDLGGGDENVVLKIADLSEIDTAGAFAVARALGNRQVDVVGELRPEFKGLASLINSRRQPFEDLPPKPRSKFAVFDRIGRDVVDFGQEAYRGQVFAGRMVMTLVGLVRHPRRVRLTPLVLMMEQAGLAATPIVFLMTFFIGAVLALVGSNMLQTLGVKIYAVELVGIGVLREFGAVVAAILFSGRSASAFAAQLGSMRMNQEIDAMQVMGVDVFEALVAPRVIAALIMLPLLILVADLGGLAGGMLVSSALLNISPDLFLQRLVDSVGIQQFWVGLAKAPLFALVIGATGCRQGLSVGSDVESLGARVTAAVVQSIFLIIMFDALFAVLFWRLDL